MENMFTSERRQTHVCDLSLPLSLRGTKWVDGGSSFRADDRHLYVSTSKGKLVTLHLGGCEEAWELDAAATFDWEGDGRVECYQSMVSGDRVYTLAGSRELTRLVCLDSKTGEVAWTFEHAGTLGTRQGLASNLAVFVTAIDGEEVSRVAINPGDGALKWEQHGPHLAGLAAPWHCLLTNGSQVAVEVGDRSVACLDVADGEEVWCFDFSERDLSLGKSWLREFETHRVHHLMSIGDAVYATVCNHLVCLDAETGEERWWVETDLGSGTAVYDASRHRIHYVLATRLLTINPDTGEVLADHDNSGQVEDVHVLGLATVTTDHFLCASWRAPELYALDKETGELAWKTELEDRVGAKTPPVVVDGRVYVLDLSGNLYVFESE
ncbi:MAG: PQQ-binding-like beta-propeller repeat protein [Myxococcota bacterium]